MYWPTALFIKGRQALYLRAEGPPQKANPKGFVIIYLGPPPTSRGHDRHSYALKIGVFLLLGELYLT